MFRFLVRAATKVALPLLRLQSPLPLRQLGPLSASFTTTTKNLLREEKTWYPQNDKEYLDKLNDTVLLVPPEDTVTPDLYPSDLFTRTVMLNFGPGHPGAHGLIRMILTLSEATSTGIIQRADPHIGFMHRGTEILKDLIK